MKLVAILCGFLVIAGVAGYEVRLPATGPSGTVCESAGGSCVGVDNGTNIAYKGNCSKYIVCWLDCGCDMNCPEDLHFNSKLQVCDWPDNAGCDSSLSTPSTPSGTPESSTPGSGTPESSTPGSGTPGSSTPGSGSGPATGPSGTVCESDGGSCVGIKDGVGIAYSGNCEKYIMCFLECGCDMECPAGLHFNTYLQVCDWPQDAGCDSSYTTVNSTETSSTASSSSTKSTSATDSTTAGTPSVTDSTTTAATPTVTDSTTTAATPTVTDSTTTAATPTVTDSTTTAATPTVTDSTTTAATPTVTDSTTTAATPTVTDSTTTAATPTVTDSTTTAATPTVTDSTTTAATPTVTDSTTTAATPTVTDSTTTAATPTVTVSTTAGTPVVTDSTTKTTSSSGTPSYPATGPSGTVCESAGGSCVGVADGTNIAYSSNCSKYIVCWLDCGCDMDCPKDLHFNSKLQVCDWPDNADCDPSLSTPSTPSGTPESSTPGSGTPESSTPGSGTPESSTPGSGTPESSTPGSGTPESSTPGSGTPESSTPGSGSGTGPATGPSGTVCESAGGSCAGTKDGEKIAYSGDCQKYVVCFLECGCDMKCPDGLSFNTELQVCDWPENSGCASN